jgi:glycosyltransferase involved in cell wall biosynthesis
LFRIVFGGNICGEYNLSALFRAADHLLARRPLADLRVEVVTPSRAWVEREAPRYPRLAPQLVVRPPVSHVDVVELYRSADALALCSLDPLSVPGKLYEYIAAGPPVLAFVVPGTDTEGLLAKTGAGLAVPADDPERGAAAIEALHDAWARGDAPRRREDEVQRLTRQRQVEELVATFERVVREGGR